MGILIKATVRHTLRPKRVRISEEDSPLLGHNQENTLGSGTQSAQRHYRDSGGLVRRNAMRTRWLRRAIPQAWGSTHVPSPSGSSIGAGVNLAREHERDDEELEHEHEHEHESPMVLEASGREDRRAGMVPPQVPVHSLLPPPRPHPRYRDLEGMSLNELESRADELRRTLNERHNIRFDFGELSSTSPRRDYELDSYDPEASRISGDNDNASRTSRNSDQQASQSIMFEIRRRQTGRQRQIQRDRRARRAARVSGGEPRSVDLDDLVEHVEQSRRQEQEQQREQHQQQQLPQTDELEVRGPSENWPRRVMRIHRAVHLRDENNDNNENNNNNNEAEQRRYQNRNSYVIMEEPHESRSGSGSESEDVPLGFDAGRR